MRPHTSLSFKLGVLITIAAVMVFASTRVFAASCDIDPAGTYIEAENFSGSVPDPDSQQNFLVVPDSAANGGKYLQSGTGGSGTSSPQYEIKNYKVNFTTTGTYYLWMRAQASSDSTNSMFFGLDGNNYKAWAVNTFNTWTWTKDMQVGGVVNTINVTTTGEHVINIAMRESNTKIDGFFLTTNASFTPTNTTVPSSVTSVNPTDCSGSGSTLCDINASGTYIEAEHYTGSSNHSTDDDKNLVTVPDSNANGGYALEAGNDGTAANSPSYEVKLYRVNFPQAGTYNFWIRGIRGDNSGSEDSMFYTIDNQTWRAWDINDSGGYTWTNNMQVSTNAITVTAGEHTIKVAMRERDARIDGFYLTTGGETPNDNTVPNNVTSLDPNNCENKGKFSVSPPSLGPTNFIGYNAASSSFTVSNIGTETITNVQIAVDQSWLSVTPSTLAELAVNETKTIQVNYTTSALAAGTYSANIDVTSASALNSPTVQVTLLVKAVPSSAACGEIPLYAENLVNPAIMVQLDTSGSMDTSMYILAGGENPATPDLKGVVQEIVDLPSWASGNAMAFVISGSGKRRAWSYDGQPNGSPKLFVTYTLNSTTEETTHRVALATDDVQGGSTLNTTATYLELGSNPVGLRFTGVNIPPGATINKAEIKFLIYDATNPSGTENFVVKGIKQANVDPLTLSDLTTASFTSSVAWDNVQSWGNTMSRIAIAEDVLKEVFLDRSISWGFATWAGGNGSEGDSDGTGNNYTNYRIGIHNHDNAHQTALQDKADDGSASGFTPLAPTMQAGLDYFKSLRTDGHYNQVYPSIGCQPRILVLVTDGIGNTGSTMALVKERTEDLADEGISVVAVGFGIPNDEADQIREIANTAQARGKEKEDDDLYALHEEDASGNGIPFLAQSREDFINAMNSIVKSVKAQVFHGGNPAPTTSADDGELLLSASFDASDWSGDMTATKFDAYTGALESTALWSAKDVMPNKASIKGYIYDSTQADKVSVYTDASLATDNFLCKPLGDIINSTPVIVGKPPYFYNFDGYKSFKYNTDVNGRTALAYVNANDGALHAFSLKTGVEQWRFYPGSVIAKLQLMGVDPTKDMCSSSYCHEFLNDGSPQAADVYNGTSWKTILTSGLGKGGKAYFTLDITHGNDFGDTTTNASKYLWEFTESDDSAIGLAIANPEIERVEKHENVSGTWKKTGASWVTYFGSGPETTDLLQVDKEAYLYAVRSYDKAMVWRSLATSAAADTYKVKLEPTTLKNDIPAPPVVINVDYNDYMSDRIYLGNRYGDMFRVNHIGEGEVPVVSKIFNSTNTDHSTPIMAKAGYAFAGDPDRDQLDDIRVYFGTGKYTDQIDKISNDQQYFFGLFDGEGSTSPEYTMNDLFKLTTDIVQGYALDSDGNKVDLNGDSVVNSEDLLTVRTIDCAAASKDASGRCNYGGNSWVLSLKSYGLTAPSERSMSQPLVVGGIVFFTTFIPDGDVCEGNGDAYLMAIDWKSGTARNPDSAVFDLNGDGTFDESDATVEDASGVRHNVSGLAIGTGVPSDPVLHNDVLFVGTTGQPPKPIKVNIPGLRARLKAWRQVVN